MGSSIALTLWAFLGMESAAQNSSAVEDPKRNVPLACMFGTLGAAAIYILSTTVIQGVAQSVLALTTISPSLSEQFGVLVNLAVVTNVVPYIISLSALPVMLQAAGVASRSYRKTIAVVLVALAYSVYAIYASGKDAVFGGMVAWGIGLVIWGFIAPRFAAGARAEYRRAA